MQYRKRNANLNDIENEVNQWRNQNLKKVEINLFPGEKEYLESLNCIVLPILYEVKDKNLKNLKDCPNFLKNRQREKTKRVLRLKKRELNILDYKNIEYEPLGYVVYL